MRKWLAIKDTVSWCIRSPHGTYYSMGSIWTNKRTNFNRVRRYKSRDEALIMFKKRLDPGFYIDNYFCRGYSIIDLTHLELFDALE